MAHLDAVEGGEELGGARLGIPLYLLVQGPQALAPAPRTLAQRVPEVFDVGRFQFCPVSVDAAQHPGELRGCAQFIAVEGIG